MVESQSPDTDALDWYSEHILTQSDELDDLGMRLKINYLSPGSSFPPLIK